jgi:hypothetical protein
VAVRSRTHCSWPWHTYTQLGGLHSDIQQTARPILEVCRQEGHVGVIGWWDDTCSDLVGIACSRACKHRGAQSLTENVHMLWEVMRSWEVSWLRRAHHNPWHCSQQSGREPNPLQRCWLVMGDVNNSCGNGRATVLSYM